MKYFLMETDEKNKCPYNINKNRAIDARLLTRQSMHKIPRWNVLEMDFPSEGFFPDMICNPWILVSECYIKTIMMYEPAVLFRAMKLWHKGSGVNATYFFPFLNELECLSDSCQYNSVGNRISRLVLDRSIIEEHAVFQIKGYARKCIVGRMDFVESLLRRGAAGIRFTEVEIEI